jgi:predicted small integral membrane protein
MSSSKMPIFLGTIVALQVLGAITLFLSLPVKDGARDWFAPLIAGGWMAWTFPTAVFFLVILALITMMAVWEYLVPGGSPRVGILRFETTRGDRLFISLLGSAFICLAWLGLVGASLWWALGLCVLYAIFVFRTV